MIPLLQWILLAWVGGTLAILGSLMMLGTGLLWLVPPGKVGKTGQREAMTLPLWRNRVALLVFSITIALVGLTLLTLVPFPKSQTITLILFT